MFNDHSIKQITIILLVTFYSFFTHAKEITVSAAASLNEAFTDIGKIFQQENPDIKVFFNFAASGVLYKQISQGAPVDIFASADQLTMAQMQKEKLIISTSKINFTKNNLVLITPITNTINITELEKLQSDYIHKIAIGNPKYVPAGRYAKKALQEKQQWNLIQSKIINAQNVRQVLSYVTRKEVDVGFVYQSDALLIPQKVKIILKIPNINISYPIAIIQTTKKLKESQKFIDFVLSAKGQKILTNYGFQPIR